MCCALISRATLTCSLSFPRALLPGGERAEDHGHSFKTNDGGLQKLQLPAIIEEDGYSTVPYVCPGSPF